jgi:hypothetical protein
LRTKLVNVATKGGAVGAAFAHFFDERHCFITPHTYVLYSPYTIPRNRFNGKIARCDKNTGKLAHEPALNNVGSFT